MKAWLPLTLAILVAGKVYLQEEFPEDWESRWVSSNWKADGSQAKFTRSPGEWFVDASKDSGLRTSQNHKFYAISTKFPSFNNKDKPLVIQFTVKHEQNLDCGGGYLKLLRDNFDQDTFGGETPYLVMFGPDICGAERRTHLILPHGTKNYLNNKKFKAETDQFTHQYTAVIRPDNTFQFLIDNQEVASGPIEEYWDILEPKQIADPDAKKPQDWVDEPTVVDPEDKKPEGWDDIPEFIVDEKATKPDDWNDQEATWEAPKIRNPKFGGEWKPKRIPNPSYKGPWSAPKIANPAYKPDNKLYLMNNIGGVGFEIWQVTAGTVFDNVFVGDSLEEAKAFSERTFKPRKEGEPEVKKIVDQEKEQKAREVEQEDNSDSKLDFEEDFKDSSREDL